MYLARRSSHRRTGGRRTGHERRPARRPDSTADQLQADMALHESGRLSAGSHPSAVRSTAHRYVRHLPSDRSNSLEEQTLNKRIRRR